MERSLREAALFANFFELGLFDTIHFITYILKTPGRFTVEYNVNLIDQILPSENFYGLVVTRARFPTTSVYMYLAPLELQQNISEYYHKMDFDFLKGGLFSFLVFLPIKNQPRMLSLIQQYLYIIM